MQLVPLTGCGGCLIFGICLGIMSVPVADVWLPWVGWGIVALAGAYVGLTVGAVAFLKVAKESSVGARW